MSDNLKIIKFCILSSLFLLWSHSAIQAKQALTFEQWKQQQERHDLRLQQQSPVSLSIPTTVQGLPLVNHAQLTTLKTTNQPVEPSHIPILGTGIKVNINRATAQELSVKLESVGMKKAQAIIAYRDKNGQFKHVDEIKNVKGIGNKIFELNRDRIKLND